MLLISSYCHNRRVCNLPPGFFSPAPPCMTRPSASLQSLILAAAIIVLPTVWLRDLSLLSFLSVGGIFASLALLALVGWEGVAVTGFPHDRPPLVTWSGVPVSIGLFCFCFSGGCLLGWGRVCTVGLSCAQPPRHCRFCC